MIRLGSRSSGEFKPNRPHYPDWTGGNPPKAGTSGANRLFKAWTTAEADEERENRTKWNETLGWGNWKETSMRTNKYL